MKLDLERNKESWSGHWAAYEKVKAWILVVRSEVNLNTCCGEF